MFRNFFIMIKCVWTPYQYHVTKKTSKGLKWKRKYSLPNRDTISIHLPPPSSLSGSQNVSLNNLYLVVFTAHKRSSGKVMFLHLSVSHSVHREGCIPACNGVCLPLGLDTHPPGQTPPLDTPPTHTPSFRDDHWSGRYASYWNAFFSLVT